MNETASLLCPAADCPCLRQLEPEDASPLLALLRSGAAAGLFSGDAEDLTLSHAQNFILSALLTAGDDFRAVSDGTGAFLGLIGLKDMSPERAEFCVALLPEARRRGLGRGAAEQLLQEAFSGDGAPARVFMYTRPDNEATNAFNLALGFRRQEPEADAPDGTAAMNWYGVSREEFMAGRKQR